MMAPSRYVRYFLALLRVITAFLFMCHGVQKIFGAFGGFGPEHGTAPFMSKFWVGGVLESGGGLLLLLGLLTRLVAFILAGEMAVAYFTAHASGGFFPLVNHGELAVLYCFIFLYMAAAGGGAPSLDALLFERADEDAAAVAGPASPSAASLPADAAVDAPPL
jgi:putative oxidoreductase